LLACSGHDIFRKGTVRKSRYLFSFPGRLAVVAGSGGGKIGQLEHLDTPNPTLAMDFPQVRGTPGLTARAARGLERLLEALMDAVIRAWRVGPAA
jgi:hypothetical protein